MDMGALNYKELLGAPELIKVSKFILHGSMYRDGVQIGVGSVIASNRILGQLGVSWSVLKYVTGFVKTRLNAASEVF